VHHADSRDDRRYGGRDDYQDVRRGYADDRRSGWAFDFFGGGRDDDR
jgi:hypothetical protein